MKIISRFFTISLLAAAIIIPFFIKTENGKPSLGMPTVDDFIPDKVLPDSLTGNSSESSSNSSGSTQSFLKWQDTKGVWHYGDRPPPGSKNISSVQVNTNANIIQAVKVPTGPGDVQPLIKAEPKMSDTLADGKLTPADALNVMSDAKAVRDMMESRSQALKEITGE